MSRTFRSRPRTPSQARADRHADELAIRAGRSIADVRKASRLTQERASERAGLARSTFAAIEARSDGGVTLTALSRAAMAAGGELQVYVRTASAADQPRDAVHLRHQELVARTAVGGAWRVLSEEQVDRDARTSRAADVLLNRREEWAILEVHDWFSDVGASFRDWDRRLAAVERYAIARMGLPDAGGTGVALPRVSGCWVVRATVRNRRLIADHRHLFQARFPASARAWLDALGSTAPMPAHAALLWVTVDGTRLVP